MEMIFCPNCGKRSGFKRALGFGTFFMVLITFGLWLLMLPFYPVRCINCGLMRASAKWENASRGGKILIACFWICVVVGSLMVLYSMRATPRSEQPTQPERQPTAAEISKKEGQQQPSSEPISAPEHPSQALGQPADTPQAIVAPPSNTESNPPAPPAEESKPTSGVLCNGPVEVRQNWEFTFRNLPGDRLKLTFDHDAWLPIINREPDGTQTVIMRSIKPGIQTKCDIRWEIVQ